MVTFLTVLIINVVLFGVIYGIGYLATEKEHRDTWKGVKTMEINKSRKLSEEWEKKHPVLNLFQDIYYEIRRKCEFPEDTVRDIKWFIQRGKRGYSDCDVWGFDYYLSKVIKEGCLSIKNNCHGHPCDLTFKEWKKILTHIAWTFEVE